MRSRNASQPQQQSWSPRRPLALGIFALIALVLGLGGWAGFASLAGAIVAHGQIEVESQIQTVQHPDGGVVSQIMVRNGDLVKAGDILIQMDPNRYLSELAIIESQYFESLARRGRLEAERADLPKINFPALLMQELPQRPELADKMDGQRSLFKARRDGLFQSLEQLAKQSEQVIAQAEGIMAQTEALDRQRLLLRRELEDAQSLLAKGLAQAPRVMALEREAARLDGQHGELVAAKAQIAAKATEIDILRLRQSTARREEAETELSALADREMELAEKRGILLESIARLEIRAPVAGVIHQLSVTTPRSVIRPAETLLYLVPQDRPLIVSARIAPKDIDQVHQGQQVKLRFPAFSSRTTPELGGTLSGISADAVQDEQTGISFYRAEITIGEQELAYLGQLQLMPGMPVEVYIRTGDQTPLAYLLKPFTDYLSRAMREN